MDKIFNDEFFDAYEFVPHTKEDLIFLRHVTLLSGFMLELSKLDVLAFGFVRVLETAIPVKSAKKVMNLCSELTVESANLMKKLGIIGKTPSLWLDANILLINLNHFSELLKIIADDFKHNMTIVLFLEYTYNIVNSIIRGMRFFIRGFDINKLREYYKADNEKINKFVDEVINGLWSFERHNTLEKRLSLVLTILGFVSSMAEIVCAGISESIESEVRKRGGVPENESPED